MPAGSFRNGAALAAAGVAGAAAASIAAVLVLAGCAAVASSSSAMVEENPRSASPATTVAGATTVVTIGDSIMAGSGLAADEAWPALLAGTTGADIVNLGCNGAGFVVVGDCGADFAGLVDQAVALAPDVVIVQSSDNDVDATQSDIDDATDATIDRLRAALPNARILGIGTLWQFSDGEPDAIGWSTEALRRAVEEDGGVFVSIGQPLQGRSDLLQWDGEHPNAEGQAVLRSAVQDALDVAGMPL